MLIHFNHNSRTHTTHGINCLNIFIPFVNYDNVCVEFNNTILQDRQEELISSVCVHCIKPTNKLMIMLYLEISKKLYIFDKVITILNMSNMVPTQDTDIQC